MFFINDLPASQRASNPANTTMAKDNAINETLFLEASALEALFTAMKMDDVDVYVEGSHLVATDDLGNHWADNEIFEFALNECLTFGRDGKLIDGFIIDDQTLSQVLHYAAQRSITICGLAE